MAPRGRRAQPADRLVGGRRGRVPRRAGRRAGALRARDYPFGPAGRSFRLGADAGEPGPCRLLAYGANRSPAALARKLGDPDPPVVALHGRLRGFDVVYSAHLSPHGAVPGTLWPSDGTDVDVHVLHVSVEQVAVLRATEPNYELRRLGGLDLALDGDGPGPPDNALDAFVSRHGALAVAGAPVALAAAHARGRALEARAEEAVLALVRDRLAPGEDLDAFVRAGIADPALQVRRTAVLRADALALEP